MTLKQALIGLDAFLLLWFLYLVFAMIAESYADQNAFRNVQQTHRDD